VSSDNASVREWTDILRRIRFGRSVRVSEKVMVSSEKVLAVARVLATYADADGSRVYPSVARVAVDAPCDYTTAKRAMSVLRRFGLIRFVRKRGLVDEYQLAIPVDLLEHVEVLTPPAYELEVERVADRNRRRTGAWRTRTAGAQPDPETEVQVPDAPVPPAPHLVDNHGVQVRGAPVPVDPTEPGTGAGRPGTTASTGASGPAVQVRAAPATHQDLDTRTTHHSRRDLRTDVAVVGRPQPPDDPLPLPRRLPGAVLDKLVLAGAIRPEELPDVPDGPDAIVLPFRRPRRSA
jgi:hypothetical protein